MNEKNNGNKPKQILFKAVVAFFVLFFLNVKGLFAALDLAIEGPSSVCLGQETDYTISLSSDNPLTGVALGFDYQGEILEVVDGEVTSDRNARWEAGKDQIRLSAFYLSENTPQTLNFKLTLKGKEEGKASLDLNPGVGGVADTQGAVQMNPISKEISISNCDGAKGLLGIINWFINLFKN
jgi:hypothetical protein